MSNTSYNPYEIAQQQFDSAAEKIGLEIYPLSTLREDIFNTR